jgi:outer membrane protein OmpA-like peptidoglycan-associated protein
MTALVPGLAVEVKDLTTPRTNWSRTMSSSVARPSKPQKTSRLADSDERPSSTKSKTNSGRTTKLQQEQQQLTAEEQRTAANKAAIAAANKRFGELGDYNILGEVTVLFGNGQVTIEPQYKPQLLKLAQQAMGITGYVIMVKGYASKVGSAALNQKLSTERAQNVANFLEQQGKIPLTNMLAPGAMGTSKQWLPTRQLRVKPRIDIFVL